MDYEQGVMGKTTSILVVYLALFISTPSHADSETSKPDRYLFDKASEVYRVFAEVRVPKPMRSTPSDLAARRAAVRALASVSPILKRASIGGETSLASQIGNILQSGQVMPGDIQLPNASSQDTQDASN